MQPLNEIRAGAVDEETSPLVSKNKTVAKEEKLTCETICMVIVGFVLVFISLMLLTVLIMYISVATRYPKLRNEIHWNWAAINTSDLHFPDDFMWGTSTSAHQVEGFSYNNQWWLFENSRIDGKSPIRKGHVSGDASNHWNLYPKDIFLMKNELKANSYRFSIEWSKIEPEQGKYNQSAIEHYHKEIELLVSSGIEPIVTLHHFTEPIWFRRLSAFEKRGNIEHFVNFAIFAFNEYSANVSKWCTFNEPNTYSLMGYSFGAFPPAKKDHSLTAKVMRNLAEAHVKVYDSIKKQPRGKQAQVGIVLNWQQFDPIRHNNAFDRMAASILNSMFTGTYLNFFKTGVFQYHVPYVVDLEYVNKNAPESFDFLGLNYYSHRFVQYKLNRREPYVFTNRRNVNLTDMGLPIYPEGIYRAIKEASQLNKPIIITENGIADAMDNQRSDFIKRHLYAVSKVINEGYSIKGYLYRSLCDGFEWNEGFDMKFGLYEVDYKTQERKLRKGSKALIDIATRFRRVE